MWDSDPAASPDRPTPTNRHSRSPPTCLKGAKTRHDRVILLLRCIRFYYGKAINGWNRCLNISSPPVRRAASRGSFGKPMILDTERLSCCTHLAAQLKKPENRVEAVGRVASEAVGASSLVVGIASATTISPSSSMSRTMRAWLLSRWPLPQEAPSSQPRRPC